MKRDQQSLKLFTKMANWFDNTVALKPQNKFFFFLTPNSKYYKGDKIVFRLI